MLMDKRLNLRKVIICVIFFLKPFYKRFLFASYVCINFLLYLLIDCYDKDNLYKSPYDTFICFGTCPHPDDGYNLCQDPNSKKPDNFIKESGNVSIEYWMLWQNKKVQLLFQLRHGVSRLMGSKKQGFCSKINSSQMKLLYFVNWHSVEPTKIGPNFRK